MQLLICDLTYLYLKSFFWFPEIHKTRSLLSLLCDALSDLVWPVTSCLTSHHSPIGQLYATACHSVSCSLNLHVLSLPLGMSFLPLPNLFLLLFHQNPGPQTTFLLWSLPPPCLTQAVWAALLVSLLECSSLHDTRLWHQFTWLKWNAKDLSSKAPRGRSDLGWILALSLGSCVILNKLFNFSETVNL